MYLYFLEIYEFLLFFIYSNFNKIQKLEVKRINVLNKCGIQRKRLEFFNDKFEKVLVVFFLDDLKDFF